MADARGVGGRLRNVGVSVPDVWLNDCITFVSDELRKKKLPLAADSIYKAVFAQWLAFDLTELNFATLPAGLGRAKKTVLSGTFCLQIEKIWDAGSPCYAQYRKLIGTENSNAEVTANDQSQNFWEPKPRRLLMMEISDGVQQVKAMEYKSIPRLSMNTSPGTKVKLVGSIQCRLGVLLLSSGDLEVLGGQVDSLVEKNAAVKVLAAKLGISPAEVQPQKPVKTEMENESNETNGLVAEDFDDEDDLMAQIDLDGLLSEESHIATPPQLLTPEKDDSDIIDLT